MTSLPKRHHFLPIFYQNGFTKHERLVVFDRETGKYWTNKPVNIAVITHFYTFEDAAGQKRPEVEHFFANTVEAKVRPVIEKLDQREPITADEKSTLANFISFLHVRVPRWKRSLEELMSGGAKLLNDLSNEPDDVARERPSIDIETLRSASLGSFQFGKGEVFDENTPKEMWLNFMLRLGTEMQSVFTQMKWLVMHAKAGTSFLTTDAPVTIIRPRNHPEWRGAGFATPGAITAVPLTSGSCLLMTYPGELIAHQDASKTDVRELNQFLVANCERYVIGREEAHVRSLVQKTRVDRLPKPPLVEINGGRRDQA